jgi:hypothetical protein
LALSNISGECDIHLTSSAPANSIFKQSQEHSKQNPHVYETGIESVRLDTLDKVLAQDSRNIDILKIDVEGAELLVLEGAAKALERTNFVIMEISLARDSDISNQAVFKIFHFMNDNNFYLYSLCDLYLFDKPASHLGLAQFDVIFKNHSFQHPALA